MGRNVEEGGFECLQDRVQRFLLAGERNIGGERGILRANAMLVAHAAERANGGPRADRAATIC